MTAQNKPYARLAAWLATFTDPAPCWLWTNATNGRGYGKLTSRIYAHRAAWELVHGPLPHGLDVLHRCDHPPCCNPSHLFAGTARQNAADMIAKHRAPIGDQRPHAKLNAQLVHDIRRASGLQKDIAARYGVSRRLIGMVRKGTRWTHVP